MCHCKRSPDWLEKAYIRRSNGPSLAVRDETRVGSSEKNKTIRGIGLVRKEQILRIFKSYLRTKTTLTPITISATPIEAPRTDGILGWGPTSKRIRHLRKNGLKAENIWAKQLTLLRELTNRSDQIGRKALTVGGGIQDWNVQHNQSQKRARAFKRIKTHSEFERAGKLETSREVDENIWQKSLNRCTLC